MRPLLFIILLTISLIILIYLTLTWVQPARPGQRVRPGRFAFEAAPELFRYVEPDLYLDPNRLKLTRNSPTRITAYWRMSREHWRENGKSPHDLAAQGKLNLRLYRSGDLLEIEDIPVDQTSGSCRLEVADDFSCCVSLGIKENDRFTPWLFSNTLVREPAMEYSDSRRV